MVGYGSCRMYAALGVDAAFLSLLYCSHVSSYVLLSVIFHVRRSLSSLCFTSRPIIPVASGRLSVARSANGPCRLHQHGCQSSSRQPITTFSAHCSVSALLNCHLLVKCVTSEFQHRLVMRHHLYFDRLHYNNCR